MNLKDPASSSPESRSQRVISLLPAATDAIVALGLQNRLVGRSHACREIAADANQIPIVTAPNLSTDRSPAQIDAHVRSVAEKRAELFTIDLERLIELEPDLIVTQDLCDVCAMTPDSVRAIAESIPSKPRVVTLGAMTIEGVFDDLVTLADQLGARDASTQVLSSLRERLWRAQEHVNPYASDAGVVGFLEWTDPLYVAGHWNVQLIERAGGTHPWNETVAQPQAGAAAGPQQAERIAGKSIPITNDLFAALDPDQIIIAPCGLPLDRAHEEARSLLKQDWFSNLKAVQTNRVAVVDGARTFSNAGPSLVDAFEFLVGFLNHRETLIPADFPWKLLSTGDRD